MQRCGEVPGLTDVWWAGVEDLLPMVTKSCHRGGELKQAGLSWITSQSAPGRNICNKLSRHKPVGVLMINLDLVRFPCDFVQILAVMFELQLML